MTKRFDIYSVSRLPVAIDVIAENAEEVLRRAGFPEDKKELFLARSTDDRKGLVLVPQGVPA